MSEHNPRQMDLVALAFAAPAVRAADPETCLAAAAGSAMHASLNRIRVLASLMDGAKTDFELGAALGLQQTSAGKRRGECRDAGLVEILVDGDGNNVKRPAPSGSPALVWTITDKGRAFYFENRGGVGH